MTSFRKLWSEEEDITLRREVAKQGKGGVKDWRGPAATLPGRNNKGAHPGPNTLPSRSILIVEDCRRRWLKLKSPVNKGAWSEEENYRLREAVQVHGKHWVEVAKAVKTRHADQCAKRWLHFLDPNLDYSQWTEQEDKHLVAEVESNGRNWRKIVNEVLLRRSATDAKNRFNILQRGKNRRKRSIDDTASDPSRRGSLEPNISDSNRASWSPSDDYEDILARFDPQSTGTPDTMAMVSGQVGATEALCPVNYFEEMLADHQGYEFDSTVVPTLQRDLQVAMIFPAQGGTR